MSRSFAASFQGSSTAFSTVCGAAGKPFRQQHLDVLWLEPLCLHQTNPIKHYETYRIGSLAGRSKKRARHAFYAERRLKQNSIFVLDAI
jgi:hypothetical protein